MKDQVELTLHYKTYEHPFSDEWLVFLHGFGGNYNIFNKQMDYFKEKYNLVFIDLPGHGKSPFPPGIDNLLSSTSQQVIHVLDRLNISSAHFLGVSLGTVIMQTIAMEHTDRIKSMTLAGAAGKWLKWGELIGKITISYPLSHILPYMFPFKTFAHILMPKRNHSTSRNFFIREAHKLGKQAYLAWAYVLRDSHKVYEQLTHQSNTIPKLYVSGSEDHMFLKGITKHVKKEALAHLHVIQQCGHVCNIEKASEFNRLVMEFIDSIGGSRFGYGQVVK
ncbi:alpha/beta fold hydrolase [Pontibacillus salicampi]|uniref:Alpha/beta fold hydrolase n=1 Tax=Pontibacillus salicampi TaxID=1449801 RepID=A0ABV6LMK3_9BACI